MATIFFFRFEYATQSAVAGLEVEDTSSNKTNTSRTKSQGVLDASSFSHEPVALRREDEHLAKEGAEAFTTMKLLLKISNALIAMHLVRASNENKYFPLLLRAQTAPDQKNVLGLVEAVADLGGVTLDGQQMDLRSRDIDLTCAGSLQHSVERIYGRNDLGEKKSDSGEFLEKGGGTQFTPSLSPFVKRTINHLLAKIEPPAAYILSTGDTGPKSTYHWGTGVIIFINALKRSDPLIFYNFTPTSAQAIYPRNSSAR